MRAKPFVISAPSGAGKSSLIEGLMARFPQRLRYSISATTRTPRTGEKNGINYFFQSPQEFQALVAVNGFAEHNEVHGNHYGTPRAPLDASLAQGFSVVLDLDVYGKINFDKVYPDAIGILIVPPDHLELERRLRSRGTDPEDTIQLRLKNARAELEFAKTKGKYEYTVVNDVFEKALEELTGIFAKELG